MAELIRFIFLPFVITLWIMNQSLANAAFNVINLGAKPDGQTDSTKAFVSAWDGACASVKPALIYVPRGRYLVNRIVFNGGQCKNTNTTIWIDGSLVAPSDYWALDSTHIWLSFEWVTGVTIRGGVLDGQGSALWACKLAGNKICPGGATSLSFTGSNDINIRGLTSINSQMFHIVINGCKNVDIKGVKIVAPENSPNTDGIHIQLSTNVKVANTSIKTGDDCISIGPGTENLWIERVSCGPGHGISIGSLAKAYDELGVRNVTVKTTVFTGTQNGLRIKAWGRPSTGFVDGVFCEHSLMRNVQNPIVIDQNYCPNNEGCPNQVSGIKVNNIMYKDIRGTSATQVAIKFDCSNTNPCEGIHLENIKLTYQNQPALSSCTNADGSAYGLVEPASCL